MTQIKILAKDEGYQGEYFGDLRSGINLTFNKFISQETVMEDGQEVPKYEILINPDHLEFKKMSESRIDFNFQNFKKADYSYEISFVDSKDLLKKPQGGQVKKEDQRKRIFGGRVDNDITIVDKSYSAKLEELKNLSNLMPEEESIWKGFIKWFREQLADLSNKNSPKYQDGRKFIEELENELNKITGKGDNNEREREREREREQNQTITKANWEIRSHC